MTYIMQRRNESHLILPVRPQVRGFFKLTAIRPDGRRRPLTGWFPNLITDGGLNRMGSGSWMTHCHVGSGSATPANANTSMQTFVASTSNITDSAASAQSSAPYYGARTNTYRFGTGVAEGNLSEVGVGWSGDSSGPLFSRALIVDGGGSPTSITVLSDEVLDVTYQLRLIPPTDDWTANIDDDGPAGTTHAVTLRASSVTSSGAFDGWGFGNTGAAVVLAATANQYITVYNGSIGGITESPSGTQINEAIALDVTTDSYSNGSLERTGTVHWPLERGNLSGGISAVRMAWRNAGRWQMGFDPAIPKDSSTTLILGFKVEWSRAT